MITIIFETHSTTFDNENHVSSGHFEAELSPLGIKQSGELGDRYKDVNIDAIFCSDLQRSFNTANIAFPGRNIPIIKDFRLRECDYGNLTRHPSSEVDAEKPLHIVTPFPGGESYVQTAARVLDFLEDLAKDYDGKTVMIIGHRATQYGLNQWIGGKWPDEAVTAPWKWQPGWTYKLFISPAPYVYKMRVVALPLTISGLNPRIEFEEKPYITKNETHISLVMVRRLLPKLIEKGLSEELAEQRAMETVNKGLELFSPRFEGLTGELRLGQFEDRYSVVAMAKVSNIDDFYGYINKELGLALKIPPVHITLYTAPNKKAIGLVNNEDLISKTKELPQDQLDALKKIINYTELSIGQ